MRLTYVAAVLIAMTPIAAVACGGSGDPLGGPYGGTGNSVLPNGGNLSSASIDEDSGAVDDAGGSSSNGGGSSERRRLLERRR